MNRNTYSVSDVMTHAVVAVGRGAPYDEIVETMSQWQVRCLPVLDEAERVIGVVSHADLPCGGMPGPLTTEELMTAPAVTVQPDSSLAEAARIMVHHCVKRLPVVDVMGRLRGMLSRSDVLKVFLRCDEDIAEQVRRDITSQLFPGEPEPVGVQVEQGVVSLVGSAADPSLIPLADRLVRSVEGVVDVRIELSGPAPAAPGQPPPVPRIEYPAPEYERE